MASLLEVAQRAKVSIATVSRVLNKSDKVVPETRAVVEKALADLGYRPSRVARRLRMNTGHAHLVGLIIPDIQNPFFPEVVQAADQAARSLGYSILLGSAAYDEERAIHYLDLMVDRRVDGMIIATSQLSERSWRLLLGSPPSRCFTTSVVRFRELTLLTPATYLASHFTRNLKFL